MISFPAQNIVVQLEPMHNNPAMLVHVRFAAFLLKILLIGWFGGKHFFISFKNSAPILVFTVELNGGLNHAIFRFLFLFLVLGSDAFGSNFNS